MRFSPVRRVGQAVLVALVLALPALRYLPHWLYSAYPLSAQEDRAQSEALARRVDERVRALQQEAQRLAGQARTLVGELRKFEIERDIQTERLAEAERAIPGSQMALQKATARLAELEQQRAAQLPDLKAQLVDIYKRGRGGYARLLLEAEGIRDLGRTMRAVAGLARINEQRIAEHQQTIESLRTERETLVQKTAELQKNQEDARQARAAAGRAVAARRALIEQIDQRRDLNAQLAGELQLAHQRLQQQVGNLAAGRPTEPVDVPIAAFQGALEWPASGALSARFGGGSARASAATVANGIEITAPEGSPVRAVHAGTVAYADAFTGFGILVIVNHGRETHSLYGYLSSAAVKQGQRVQAGTELGRVGTAPAGPPALYFEIRVDGRPVDPVQWLEPK
jgi:septal ring factor EnvC (AmiA/AmiB activator)